MNDRFNIPLSKILQMNPVVRAQPREITVTFSLDWDPDIINTTPSERAYNGLKGRLPLGPMARLEEKWLALRIK